MQLTRYHIETGYERVLLCSALVCEKLMGVRDGTFLCTAHLRLYASTLSKVW